MATLSNGSPDKHPLRVEDNSRYELQIRLFAKINIRIGAPISRSARRVTTHRNVPNRSSALRSHDVVPEIYFENHSRTLSDLEVGRVTPCLPGGDFVHGAMAGGAFVCVQSGGAGRNSFIARKGCSGIRISFGTR
jgi:hypothetical protein